MSDTKVCVDHFTDDTMPTFNKRTNSPVRKAFDYKLNFLREFKLKSRFGTCKRPTCSSPFHIDMGTVIFLNSLLFQPHPLLPPLQSFVDVLLF